MQVHVCLLVKVGQEFSYCSLDVKQVYKFVVHMPHDLLPGNTSGDLQAKSGFKTLIVFCSVTCVTDYFLYHTYMCMPSAALTRSHVHEL